MSTVGSEHVSNRYGENATHPCVMEDVNSKDKLDLFLGYADSFLKKSLLSSHTCHSHTNENDKTIDFDFR